MFPAPMPLCKSVKIENIKNEHYKNLVRAEYRIIKQKTEQILSNAKDVYNHKMINDGKSKLSQRCNDFKLLEEKCKEYKIPTKKKSSITKVQSRQRVKPAAVQPIVMWTPALGCLEKNGRL